MTKGPSMAVSRSMNTNPSSSHFATSRLLLGFFVKPSPDTNPAASPTSILKTKIFSPTVKLFLTDTKPRPTWHSAQSRAIGLGIVDTLCNEKQDIHRKSSNSDRLMVLFGSQLKIQIPYMPSSSVSRAAWTEAPGSPIEFGVKNKSSQLALLSPSLRSPIAGSAYIRPPPTDMELSEDYTCVITHGLNPKTTHIFDNCIVESCGTDYSYVPLPKENGSFVGHSADFLAFCHSCNKSLGPGKDIFMCRGEKAFCSNECRPHEMIFNGGMGNASSGSSIIL